VTNSNAGNNLVTGFRLGAIFREVAAIAIAPDCMSSHALNDTSALKCSQLNSISASASNIDVELFLGHRSTAGLGCSKCASVAFVVGDLMPSLLI
jgi:hypothetical protein